MLEFGALPPEVNSGLMYAGPGSGPMLVASAAWDALADDLYLTATAYGAAISDLTSSWLGPSSASMAAAAAPYVSWISATAAQAADTAAQAKEAVVAYEAAFAMTVPPAVIAANRALLLMLVATNFFGQNTPAIAANEAEYVEMWAQDAAAMYGYAGSVVGCFGVDAVYGSAADHQPSWFVRAGHHGHASCRHVGRHRRTDGVTADLGCDAQRTGGSRIDGHVLDVNVAAVVLDDPDVVVDRADVGDERGVGRRLVRIDVNFGHLDARLGGFADELVRVGDQCFGKSFQMSGSALSPGVGSGAGALSASGMGGTAVTATAGRAASLGALSVPQGWTSAAPAFSQVASALPAASGPGATPPVVPGGPASPFGPPVGNAANVAGRGGTSSPLAARYYVRPAMVQRPVYAG